MDLLILLSCFVLSVFGDPPGGFYHAKYDHLDLDDVLNHKRLVYHYANCLLSRGPCPPQGTDLKQILPEALETTCLRCTEKQKAIVLHIVRRLKMEYPDIWKEVSDLWDPIGENLRKFEVLYGGGVIESTTLDITSNLLGNRFNEDESANELAGSIKPPTTTAKPKPTTTKLIKLTPKPVKFASITTKPPTAPTYVDTTTGASQAPQATFIIPSVTVAPLRPVYWWVYNNGGYPPMRWRPTRLIFRPQQPNWLGDISSKVIQAGSQVAGMVLSTVQALVGH